MKSGLKSFIVAIFLVYLLSAKPVMLAAQSSAGGAYQMLPVPRQVKYESQHTTQSMDALEREIRIDPKAVTHEQGYELKITSDAIHITAHDRAGAFYAEQTLNQIAQQTQAGPVKCLTIRDWPDFPVRGVMLDISRDKVPTMDTLFHLVELLASWKINHFQLYTEHTFAYQNHETAWKDASPMTADQIRILDRYCKQRFIDLVPNQNSFGHMERWLKHEEYRHLAEAPDYVDTIWGKRRWHTLYPGDPGSIELISELYDELLPNFSSKYFNVGCDETVELCNGRSKALCQEIGNQRVYLNHLLKIHELVKEHGRIMMFWADMVQNHPDVIDDLPKDMIPLLWGYRADHPFDKYCKAVAETGCQFYVCPGNSTWISIAGQTENAMANLLNAAENGLKYGASGYINTDWGDLGNFEPITVSYLGYAYGAALSWSVEANTSIDLPGVLSKFAFKDKANVMGKLVYDLGNAYTISGVKVSNSTFYGRILQHSEWSLDNAPQNQLTVEKFEAVKRYVDDVLSHLDEAEMDRPDADAVIEEMKHAGRLIHHGCDLGIARLGAKDKKTANIPKDTRQQLAADMKEIMENHKKVWLRRNRIGGLQDSLSHMTDKIELYEQ